MQNTVGDGEITTYLKVEKKNGTTYYRVCDGVNTQIDAATYLAETGEN